MSAKNQRRIVLQLLQGREPIAALARKHRKSDQTLYRWQKKLLACNEDPLPLETSDSPVSTAEDYVPKQYEWDLDSFLRRCPVCGSNMTADYSNTRTVIFPNRSPGYSPSRWVGEMWRLRSRIRRCHNSRCNRFLTPYRPEVEGRIAFPNHKLSLPLLRHLSFLHDKPLSIRQIQSRLSNGGINLAHATIANALECLRLLPTDPLNTVYDLQKTHPDQKFLLLDFFFWTRSHGSIGDRIVRDFFSGELLAKRSISSQRLLEPLLSASSPIPVLGVLSPAWSYVSDTIRELVPGVKELEIPTPQCLMSLPENTRATLELPVCYSELVPPMLD